MNQPHKIPIEAPTPTTDQIVQHLLSECKPIMSKQQVRERMAYLVDMLTKIQKKELLKKVKRCDFYFSSYQNGVPESKIKAMLKRKFSIDRRYITAACKPCQVHLQRIQFNKKQ